jgi:hypothetical protein
MFSFLFDPFKEDDFRLDVMSIGILYINGKILLAYSPNTFIFLKSILRA